MEWNVVLARVLESTLSYLLPLLIVTLISAGLAWTRKQWSIAKAANPMLTEILEQTAAIAVKAAEQAGLHGLIADKKSYAISIVENWLTTQGLPIDLDVIAAAVEAAVLDQLKTPLSFLDTRQTLEMVARQQNVDTE